jgi:hypothetical protein
MAYLLVAEEQRMGWHGFVVYKAVFKNCNAYASDFYLIGCALTECF